MNKKQVLLIHGGETHNSHEEYVKHLEGAEFILGYTKDKRKRWRYSLEKRLGKSFEVILPSMPCADNAKYKEWKIWFEKIVPFLRDGVVLIGHSLGGIFLVKYLSENDFSIKIKATHLIAPPYCEKGLQGSLADFILPKSLKRFEEQGGKIHFYHSKDDPLVPFTHLNKYAKALPRSKKVIFKNRGHFLQEEFPELVNNIKRLFA